MKNTNIVRWHVAFRIKINKAKVLDLKGNICWNGNTDKNMISV